MQLEINGRGTRDSQNNRINLSSEGASGNTFSHLALDFLALRAKFHGEVFENTGFKF